MGKSCFVLLDKDGEMLDSCMAVSESEAIDIFSDSWDMNDESLTVYCNE